MVMELNASDERGIDVVRLIIKEFCQSKNLLNDGVKLVVLDECDAMTREAQFSMRRCKHSLILVMEKYTSSTRFCLICNQDSRIIPAL